MSHRHLNLMSPERLAQGYVIVLPGIEGHSFLNRWIVRGLLQAGVPYGMEIHDWTHGPFFALKSLRDCRRHAAQVEALVEKIVRYRQSHPQQPVHLIGHSGGGAMCLFTLERLPPEVKVTSGILLLAAISPGYDLSRALQQTTRGLWNISSCFDIPALCLGTMLFGTCDGKHTIAAGCRGFHQSSMNSGSNDGPALTELRYQPRMMLDLNFGGTLRPGQPVLCAKLDRAAAG